jgi:hypothetical protein
MPESARPDWRRLRPPYPDRPDLPRDRREDYFTRPRGALAVRAVVTDCDGRTDECRLTRPAP